MLPFLYETVFGRIILKFLTQPVVSKLCGKFLDSRCSTLLIPHFIKSNHIDMREFQKKKYKNFNEFFFRKIKLEKRPIEKQGDAFIAPCDGLLSVYKIERGLVVPVKSSHYAIEDLLKNKKLAARFDGGTCLVFRLCVNHYHRYIYLDDGYKTDNVHIDGCLHTVRPIALRNVPVFTENSREYTLIKTKHFGSIIQMEVGAMLVGKIKNLHGRRQVRRGQEKGYFMYGGSTIIVLTQKDKVHFPEVLYKATEDGIETPVRMGEKLSES